MKFHTPSFLLGVGLTSAAFAARARLRPVVVEVAALGVHLGRLARGLVERQREDVEDLWAEVEERVRDRARAARRHVTPAERRPFSNGAAAART
jgi:thioredoxin reductase